VLQPRSICRNGLVFPDSTNDPFRKTEKTTEKRRKVNPHLALERVDRPSGEGMVFPNRVSVRAFGGGNATGPSPVDRRKLGSKHTLPVDNNGVPLVIHTAPVNASDYTLILPVV
jgi:hypothetical protein